MKRTKALESTAIHEAGHAVMAWRLGVRTKTLSIIPGPGTLGHHLRRAYFTGINPEKSNAPPSAAPFGKHGPGVFRWPGRTTEV